MTAITLSNRPQTFADITQIAQTISTQEYLLEVERQVASIEGGVNALAKKSFRSARFSLIKNILPVGGNILSFESKHAWEADEIIYKRKNIRIIYTEDYSEDEWENVLRDKDISLVYVSTIHQETLAIQDYGYIIQKAHKINVPVVFDNTRGGLGYIYAPLKDGADFVLTDLSSSELFQNHFIRAFIIEGANGILLSNKDKILGRTLLDNQKSLRVLNTKWTYFLTDREDLIEKSIKKEAIRKGDYSRTANYVSRWLNNQEEVMEINYAGLKASESHVHAELYFKGGYGNVFKFSLWDNEYSYSLLRGFFRSGKFKGINIEVNTNWKETIEHFSKKYRVIVPILPIYDGTMQKDGLDGLVSYLHELVTELKIERFNLVGNSLGGQVAILYSVAYPDKVIRLVLTGSAGLYESTMGASYPKRGDYAYIEDRVRYTFHNDKIVTKNLVDQVFETVNDIRKSIRVIKIVRAANGNNVADALKQITSPTLLIWGRQDRITPIEIAYKFKALLSVNTELRIIEECGHAPMMERPKQFNEALENYFNSETFAYAQVS